MTGSRSPTSELFGEGEDYLARPTAPTTLISGSVSVFALSSLADVKHLSKWCEAIGSLDRTLTVKEVRRWITKETWTQLTTLAEVFPTWKGFESWTTDEFLEKLDTHIINVKPDKYAQTMKQLWDDTKLDFKLNGINAFKI